MAKTFDKPTTNGDRRCLIIGQREGLVYPFPFEDWNSIRMGMFISYTNGTVDNLDLIGQGGGGTVTVSSAKDRLFWGAMVSKHAFPGEEGNPFVGIMSTETKSSYLINNSVFPGSLTFGGSTSDNINPGTYHANNTITVCDGGLFNALQIGNPPANNFGGPSFFCSYFGLTLTIKNKGQSNQSINVKTLYDQAFTDVSDQALKTSIIQSTYNDRGDCPWHLSGLPYPVPSSILMYLPFTTVRMRIHNIGVVKDA